jgi:predicted nuclease of predicted toxin-antitoxin system
MRFLADQDVYAITIDLLKRLGHEVVSSSQLGMARAADIQLLRAAHADGRIFLTRDRDYGGLVFVQGLGAGVIYLRILPSTKDSVHLELLRILTLYTEKRLGESFVVVEPGRHRIRRAAARKIP